MLNEAIVKWGMIAVFLFMVSNGFISTPPSEIVLSLAGALTIDSKAYFAFMLLGVVVANYLGTLILYVISIQKGKIWYDRLRGLNIFQKYTILGKFFPVSDDLVKFFNNQEWMVFACRFIPFIRSIISIPAGISGMGFARFTALSLAGITVWAFVWLWMGRTLALGIMQGREYIIGLFFVLFAISGIIGNLVRKKISKKQR